MVELDYEVLDDELTPEPQIQTTTTNVSMLVDDEKFNENDANGASVNGQSTQTRKRKRATNSNSNSITNEDELWVPPSKKSKTSNGDKEGYITVDELKNTKNKKKIKLNLKRAKNASTKVMNASAVKKEISSKSK